MSLFRKPFFRASRGVWFVEIVRGKQINLGKDRDTAFARYHELMADSAQNPAGQPGVPARPAPQLVIVLVDHFLDWCQKHRAADTYRWYRDRLQLFCNAIPNSLTITQLRNYHVQQWVDSFSSLSSGSKRNHCRAIQRAMRWAVQQGYADASPISSLEKPAAGRREQLVSGDEFSRILELANDEHFRDLLTVTWETGCRPQESLRVEARHFDAEHARWIFPASEAKGGKLPRIVYLTPKALEVCERLVSKYPSGPLFRNTAGTAWTPDAANCRFQRIEKKTGIRYCLYAMRHSWMNRMLVSGVDALTVAVLAGHSDPSTLAKTYQHLSQSPAYLLGQARRSTA
jgi:integrase